MGVANSFALAEQNANLGGALRGVRRTCGFVATAAALAVEGWSDGSAGPVVRAARAKAAASQLLSLHGIAVRVLGPRPRGRVVVVADHVSYLDPLVVGSIVPCATLAKAEARSWPLVGEAMAALGSIFVRRGDVVSGAVALRKARRVLLDGVSILNFPEGTTTGGGSVGAFRRGVFGLARITGIDVVPAHVSYDNPRVHWFGGQTFVPHYLALSTMVRVIATIQFGPRLCISDLRDKPEERAREVVAALGGTSC